MCCLPHFTKVQKLLDILSKPIPESILQEIHNYSQKLIQQVIKSVTTGSRYESFQPFSTERIEQLKQFDSKHAFRQEIKQFKGVCDMAIETIQLQKKSILDGTRKDTITKGWLHQIDRVVTGFLVKKFVLFLFFYFLFFCIDLSSYDFEF